MTFNTEELKIIRDALEVYIMQIHACMFPQSQEELAELNRLENNTKTILYAIKDELQ